MSEAGSGIEGQLNGSQFAAYVAGLLVNERFKLIDIGCAGGLAPGWRVFGDRLAAMGFDGNAEEVGRLATAETNPLVRYVPGMVGIPDDHPLRMRRSEPTYWHNWPSGRIAYERTQDIRRDRKAGREPRSLAAYFEEILNQPWRVDPFDGYDLDYARDFQVLPPNPEETATAVARAEAGEMIHLPPYLQAVGFDDADFLKLDIDGPDFEVLRSITQLLARPGLIGASIEVCYYGSHDANDNSFHNVDRLMREKGFDLFGLSVRTYSAAALPFAYLDVHPSMNVGGRPVQGDALYIRDLASRARKTDAAAVSDEALAKTAALFSLFNLPDHAAEILVVHRERLSRIMDVDKGLDMLAVQIQPYDDVAPDYARYIAEFERENPLLFDQYGARNKWMDEMIRVSKEEPPARQAAERRADEAERLLAEAQAELERVRAVADTGEARLREVQARALDGQRRLEAIERSSAWRLTAPLRKLLGPMRRRR